MAEDSAMFHEPLELLPQKTRDMHRAVVSVIEELQALDWYAQRQDGAQDPELRAILKHNGDEEKEHAAMLLEWIRRQDPIFEGHLRTYLFRSGPIVGREEAETNGGDGSVGTHASIGSLKGGRG